MKSIAVFCGSASGNDPEFARQAYLLGSLMAQKGIHLVYGGGKIGLMEAVARGALENGGTVTGIIPDFLLKKEVAHTGLTELVVTSNMHERKLLLNERSEGIITLPGGFGTMEELFELITWAQLGLHNKPVGILNCNGFYDHLFALLDHMRDSGLLRPEHRAALLHSTSPEGLLELMKQRRSVDFQKTIAKEKL